MMGTLLLSLLIAATLIQITGAIVGSGEVVVASKVKTIAHPDGGVIAHIWVRDGDRVKAGDPLIRFDTNVTAEDRTSVGVGKSVSIRVDLVGHLNIINEMKKHKFHNK